MKTLVVCGAGGFIGGHLVERLKQNGDFVIGIDLKYPEFGQSSADVFLREDLRDGKTIDGILARIQTDAIYQLAADMGGAGYTFTGEHDAAIMTNSVLCNVNVLKAVVKYNVPKIFFSSSACVYPQGWQQSDDASGLKEEIAYPADPDSEYGWEKLFSERLYAAYARNTNVKVRIARFHNIFGPNGTWTGGKEKVPAAICRKVAEVEDGGTIEIWGNGKQTRSFLYIDECLDGIETLMQSELSEPVNIGSDEQISINELVEMVANIAGKQIVIKHIDGPIGVRGRNSDNEFIRNSLGWAPSAKLQDGIKKTYAWVAEQVVGSYTK